MENINWICKSKNINNNIILTCQNTLNIQNWSLDNNKENFESTPSGLLQGSTKFPPAVNITLGPPNYGPSADFCKDTTQFTKLGEWTMKFDNNYTDKGSKRLRNGEFWAVPSSTFANGGWGGVKFMNGGPWGNWVGMTAVDANGVNTQPSFFEIQYYQEFNPKWLVLIRNKTDPNSYYLMTRVNISCFKYIGSSDSDQYLIYRDGYPNVGDKKTFYDNLNIPMEVSFNGQSGGAPINNSIYEVFIKPFIRSTYSFKPEPAITPFTPLSSNFSSRLFLWFDASDPNGDGSSNFNDNDPVLYWKDKSKHQIKMIRVPLSGDVNDGNIIKNGNDGDVGRGGAKARLPRIKKNFKNGLSIIRLNGTNGFLPMINHDNNTKKFIAAFGNGQAPIPNYTLIIVHHLTEYGNSSGNLFNIGTWGQSNLSITFDNHSGLGAPTLCINDNRGRIGVYSGNLLNKWAITTITKNNLIQTYINGALVNIGLKHGAAFDSNSGIIKGTYWLGIGQKNGGPFGGGNTSGFQGDIAEIMLFNNPLNDDDRKKVEAQLALKWNIKELIPVSPASTPSLSPASTPSLSPASTPSLSPSSTPSLSPAKMSTLLNYKNTLNNINQEIELIRRQSGVGPSFGPGPKV